MNPYKPLPETKTNKQLEELRIILPYTNVFVSNGSMTYNTPFPQLLSNEINLKIKELNLELIAIPHSLTNTLIVEIKR